MMPASSLASGVSEPSERALTLTEFASLPWPSDEQVEAFVEHVCDAHSWYKQLPLRRGAAFDFFLAEDAGAGYTRESPRLHHSWRTTQEYRRRFGFLDYSGPFGRDAGARLILPIEIAEASRTVLFPYVCKNLSALDACLWSEHSEDIEAMFKRRKKNPSERDALRWHACQQRLRSLIPFEAECARRLRGAAGEPDDLELDTWPPEVADYFRAEQASLSTYCALQQKEEAKIRVALARLHALHRSWKGREVL